MMIFLCMSNTKCAFFWDLACTRSFPNLRNHIFNLFLVCVQFLSSISVSSWKNLFLCDRSGVNLAVKDNNGSFISTLSMGLYSVSRGEMWQWSWDKNTCFKKLFDVLQSAPNLWLSRLQINDHWSGLILVGLSMGLSLSLMSHCEPGSLCSSFI